jgi:hypothetical protein
MLEIRRKVFCISLPIQNCMKVSNFEKAQNHRTLIGIFKTLLCQTADSFDYQPWTRTDSFYALPFLKMGRSEYSCCTLGSLLISVGIYNSQIHASFPLQYSLCLLTVTLLSTTLPHCHIGFWAMVLTVNNSLAIIDC